MLMSGRAAASAVNDKPCSSFLRNRNRMKISVTMEMEWVMACNTLKRMLKGSD